MSFSGKGNGEKPQWERGGSPMALTEYQQRPETVIRPLLVDGFECRKLIRFSLLLTADPSDGKIRTPILIEFFHVASIRQLTKIRGYPLVGQFV